jgi:hypothetical protein
MSDRIDRSSQQGTVHTGLKRFVQEYGRPPLALEASSRDRPSWLPARADILSSFGVDSWHEAYLRMCIDAGFAPADPAVPRGNPAPRAPRGTLQVTGLSPNTAATPVGMPSANGDSPADVIAAMHIFKKRHGRWPRAVETQGRTRDPSLLPYQRLLKALGVRTWPEAIQMAAGAVRVDASSSRKASAPKRPPRSKASEKVSPERLIERLLRFEAWRHRLPTAKEMDGDARINSLPTLQEVRETLGEDWRQKVIEAKRGDPPAPAPTSEGRNVRRRRPDAAG